MLILLVVVAAIVALASYALRQNINLFYTPSQLAAHEAQDGQRIQAGGLVMQGSVKRDPQSLAVRFTITDLKQQVDVVYVGILPDLFREGQGIVANGRWQNGVVMADEVLAKHDENYMPPEVAKSLKNQHQANGTNTNQAQFMPATPVNQ